jgi:hypothetical protein
MVNGLPDDEPPLPAGSWVERWDDPVVEAVQAHQEMTDSTGPSGCTCGWRPSATTPDHETHVIQVLHELTITDPPPGDAP